MPGLLIAAIEVDALGETVLAALVAGLGITFAFALTILGSVRASDFAREERWLEAGLAAGLAAVSTLVWAAAIVFGVILVAS